MRRFFTKCHLRKKNARDLGTFNTPLRKLRAKVRALSRKKTKTVAPELHHELAQPRLPTPAGGGGGVVWGDSHVPQGNFTCHQGPFTWAKQNFTRPKQNFSKANLRPGAWRHMLKYK